MENIQIAHNFKFLPTKRKEPYIEIEARIPEPFRRFENKFYTITFVNKKNSKDVVHVKMHVLNTTTIYDGPYTMDAIYVVKWNKFPICRTKNGNEEVELDTNVWDCSDGSKTIHKKSRFDNSPTCGDKSDENPLLCKGLSNILFWILFPMVLLYWVVGTISFGLMKYRKRKLSQGIGLVLNSVENEMMFFAERIVFSIKQVKTMLSYNLETISNIDEIINNDKHLFDVFRI